MKNVKFWTPFSAGVFSFSALSILLLFFSTLFAGTGEAPVSVTTRITPNTFTLGDIATYTITVQHDADIHPAAPDIPPKKGLEFVSKGEIRLGQLTGKPSMNTGINFESMILASWRFLPSLFPLTRQTQKNREKPFREPSWPQRQPWKCSLF